MPNILITMSFRGTNYHGFQVQQNALSVCTVLQNALEAVLGKRVDVKGCSRTDSGVHALGYCVSFRADTPISMYKLPLAINDHLPRDIRVLSAQVVPEAFHARYSAVAKQYLYRVYNSPVSDPFSEGLCWRVGPLLDIEAMQAAATAAVGQHDFASFMSGGSKITDTVRIIYSFTVCRQEKMLQFTVCADGYLYNMVRILVGTLVEIGAHRMPVSGMQTALDGKKRALAGPRAPAEGLFLDKVFYHSEQFAQGGEWSGNNAEL